jgi:hypothetical protein
VDNLGNPFPNPSLSSLTAISEEAAVEVPPVSASITALQDAPEDVEATEAIFDATVSVPDSQPPLALQTHGFSIMGVAIDTVAPASNPVTASEALVSGDIFDSVEAAAIAPTPPAQDFGVSAQPNPPENLQDGMAKPAASAVTVADDEWREGDQVRVDAFDLPASLKRFDGRLGAVEAVSVASCLVRFDDDGEVMHILFRGLRKA